MLHSRCTREGRNTHGEAQHNQNELWKICEFPGGNQVDGLPPAPSNSQSSHCFFPEASARRVIMHPWEHAAPFRPNIFMANAPFNQQGAGIIWLRGGSSTKVSRSLLDPWNQRMKLIKWRIFDMYYNDFWCSFRWYAWFFCAFKGSIERRTRFSKMMKIMEK